MATDNRKKDPSFTSPRLKFQWPKLTEPDYGNEKYPKPDGQYTVNGIGRADDPAVKKFIADLTPHYEEALAAASETFKGLKVETRKKLKQVTENALFTELYDKDTEEPTGEISFKFSMTASGTRKKGPKAGQKWTRKPMIFDAKGQRMAKAPQIWSGTEGRVSFTTRPYFVPGTGAAGLSLRLEAVKILALVSEGTRSADSYGFGGEEEGYEHEEDMTTDETTTDESGNAGGGEDDGSGDF
jgi:hypothetical protein